MRTLAALILTITVSGCTSSGMAGDGCRFSAARNATVAVGSAAQARIIAGAGKLNVQGRPGLSEVRIRGKACASDEDALGNIQLTAEKRGDEIFVEAKLPESGPWHANGQASLDLEIEVPETLMLDVEDDSGAVAIRGARSLRLNDGSGAIAIEGIAGDVFVQDGSGSIAVKGVGGNLDLTDGSGSLSATAVEGSVKVRDGSGSISVSQVQGDFTVESDGSGSVHHENIGGRVSVSD